MVSGGVKNSPKLQRKAKRFRMKALPSMCCYTQTPAPRALTSPHVALALWKTLEAPGDLVSSSCAFHSWLQLPSWGFQQGRWRTPSLSRGGIPNACVDITQTSPSFYFKMNLPQSSQLKAWRENHICLLSFPLQKPLFFFSFFACPGVSGFGERLGQPCPFGS